jgi:uncharacterized membrane protein YgaE (UPF0421/DUF939 family)
MPEPNWATITTLIVMQSTLEASLDVSKRRIPGTALGGLPAATAKNVVMVQFES